MNPQLEQRILDKLHNLSDQRLQEVLDFTDFLLTRGQNSSNDAGQLSRIRGKYKNRLSSADDFAQRKSEEIQLENGKWERP